MIQEPTPKAKNATDFNEGHDQDVAYNHHIYL